MSRVAAQPSDPYQIHTAVLEVYDALRGAIYAIPAFPTCEIPTGKASPDDALRRLNRLSMALQPFPSRRLTPDPFVRSVPVTVPLTLVWRTQVLPPNQPVSGSSAHDATIRLAGQVYDNLGVTDYQRMIDPATGETFFGAVYENGHGYESPHGTVISPGQPRCRHYSDLPWSAELWDRLFNAHEKEFWSLCLTEEFGPDTLLRLALEHEANLRGARPRRVRCDSADSSFWLDGRRVAGGLEDEVFAYVQALADNYPDPISFQQLQDRVPALAGVNQSRLKKKLPAAIGNLITRNSGQGHVLELPEPGRLAAG